MTSPKALQSSAVRPDFSKRLFVVQLTRALRSLRFARRWTRSATAIQGNLWNRGRRQNRKEVVFNLLFNSVECFQYRDMAKFFIALLTINVVALPGRGEIIPSNRRMIWQGNVGVQGGIPNRTKIFVNVKTTSNPRYRCTGDGVINDAPALQAALNACPAGEVVYVPTSTYRIATPVDAKVSNKTLRGDGMGKTIFLLTDGKGRFHFGRGQNIKRGGKSASGLFVSVISGATAGSTVLTVKDTSNIR